MKKEYDLSKMKCRKNPYAARLKKQITLRLSKDVIEYFKTLSDQHNIPYQSLINMYLMECMATRRNLKMSWAPPMKRGGRPLQAGTTSNRP